MVLNFYELFEKYEQLQTKEERINFLRQNASQALRSILYHTYNPNLKFFTDKFPEEYKPDNASPPGMSHSNLFMEIRKIPMFLENDSLPVKKKNTLLIQMLESLEAKEGELLVKIFKKNLDIPHLSRSIVREAFPNLLPPAGK